MCAFTQWCDELSEYKSSAAMQAMQELLLFNALVITHLYFQNYITSTKLKICKENNNEKYQNNTWAAAASTSLRPARLWHITKQHDFCKMISCNTVNHLCTMVAHIKYLREHEWLPWHTRREHFHLILWMRHLKIKVNI